MTSVISPRWHFSLSICVVLITLQRTAVTFSSVYLSGRNQTSHKSTICWSRMRSGPPLMTFVQSWRVLGWIVPGNEACSYPTAIQSSSGVLNCWTLKVLLLGTGERLQHNAPQELLWAELSYDLKLKINLIINFSVSTAHLQTFLWLFFFRATYYLQHTDSASFTWRKRTNQMFH